MKKGGFPPLIFTSDHSPRDPAGLYRHRASRTPYPAINGEILTACYGTACDAGLVLRVGVYTQEQGVCYPQGPSRHRTNFGMACGTEVCAFQFSELHPNLHTLERCCMFCAGTLGGRYYHCGIALLPPSEEVYRTNRQSYCYATIQRMVIRNIPPCQISCSLFSPDFRAIHQRKSYDELRHAESCPDDQSFALY